MRIQSVKKTTAFLIAFIFAVNQVIPYSHAQPSSSAVNVQGVVVPTGMDSIQVKSGTIQDQFQGAGDKQVILIQDAHAIPDAQHSIRLLIEELSAKYGISAVALEGAEGPIDLTLFRSFPQPQKLRETFESYLDTGELSGAVAAGVLNRTELRLSGIESQPLYEEGVTKFLEALRSKPELNQSLATAREEMSSLKRRYYSSAALELDQRLTEVSRDSGKLLEALRHMSSTVKPDPVRYPHLIAVLALQASENNGNSRALEDAINRLTGEIGPKLTSDADRRRFSEKLQAWKTERISGPEMAAYVQEIAGIFQPSDGDRLRNDTEGAKHLAELAENHRKLRDLQGTVFFEEFAGYAGEVKGRLLTDPVSQNLNRFDDELGLLEKMAELKLTIEEWKKIRSVFRDENKARPFDESTEGGRREIAGNAKLLEEFRGKLEVLESSIPSRYGSFLRFYTVAERRDAVFIEKIKTMLTAEDSCIVVAGGFHTEGLKAAFRKENISYVTLAPEMTRLSGESKYLDFMQGRVSWKDYFRVRNGRIDLYDAFARAIVDQLVKGTVPFANGAEGDSPRGDTRLHPLKEWRDVLIRVTAERGKVAASGRYTRYLDRAAAKAMAPDRVATLKAEWSDKLEKFIAGLQGLEKQGPLNEAQVLGLLNGQTTITPTAVPFGTAPARWFDGGAITPEGVPSLRLPLSERKEARTMPKKTLAKTTLPTLDQWLHDVIPGDRLRQRVAMRLRSADQSAATNPRHALLTGWEGLGHILAHLITDKTQVEAVRDALKDKVLLSVAGSAARSSAGTKPSSARHEMRNDWRGARNFTREPREIFTMNASPYVSEERDQFSNYRSGILTGTGPFSLDDWLARGSFAEKLTLLTKRAGAPTPADIRAIASNPDLMQHAEKMANLYFYDTYGWIRVYFNTEVKTEKGPEDVIRLLLEHVLGGAVGEMIDGGSTERAKTENGVMALELLIRIDAFLKAHPLAAALFRQAAKDAFILDLDGTGTLRGSQRVMIDRYRENGISAVMATLSLREGGQLYDYEQPYRFPSTASTHNLLEMDIVIMLRRLAFTLPEGIGLTDDLGPEISEPFNFSFDEARLAAFLDRIPGLDKKVVLDRPAPLRPFEAVRQIYRLRPPHRNTYMVTEPPENINSFLTQTLIVYFLNPEGLRKYDPEMFDYFEAIGFGPALSSSRESKPPQPEFLAKGEAARVLDGDGANFTDMGDVAKADLIGELRRQIDDKPARSKTNQPWQALAREVAVHLESLKFRSFDELLWEDSYAVGRILPDEVDLGNGVLELEGFRTEMVARAGLESLFGAFPDRYPEEEREALRRGLLKWLFGSEKGFWQTHEEFVQLTGDRYLKSAVQRFSAFEPDKPLFRTFDFFQSWLDAQAQGRKHPVLSQAALLAKRIHEKGWYDPEGAGRDLDSGLRLKLQYEILYPLIFFAVYRRQFFVMMHQVLEDYESNAGSTANNIAKFIVGIDASLPGHLLEKKLAGRGKAGRLALGLASEMSRERVQEEFKRYKQASSLPRPLLEALERRVRDEIEKSRRSLAPDQDNLPENIAIGGREVFMQLLFEPRTYAQTDSFDTTPHSRPLLVLTEEYSVKAFAEKASAIGSLYIRALVMPNRAGILNAMIAWAEYENKSLAGKLGVPGLGMMDSTALDAIFHEGVSTPRKGYVAVHRPGTRNVSESGLVPIDEAQAAALLRLREHKEAVVLPVSRMAQGPMLNLISSRESGSSWLVNGNGRLTYRYRMNYWFWVLSVMGRKNAWRQYETDEMRKMWRLLFRLRKDVSPGGQKDGDLTPGGADLELWTKDIEAMDTEALRLYFEQRAKLSGQEAGEEGQLSVEEMRRIWYFTVAGHPQGLFARLAAALETEKHSSRLTPESQRLLIDALTVIHFSSPAHQIDDSDRFLSGSRRLLKDMRSFLLLHPDGISVSNLDAFRSYLRGGLQKSAGKTARDTWARKFRAAHEGDLAEPGGDIFTAAVNARALSDDPQRAWLRMRKSSDSEETPFFDPEPIPAVNLLNAVGNRNPDHEVFWYGVYQNGLVIPGTQYTYLLTGVRDGQTLRVTVDQKRMTIETVNPADPTETQVLAELPVERARRQSFIDKESTAGREWSRVLNVEALKAKHGIRDLTAVADSPVLDRDGYYFIKPGNVDGYLRISHPKGELEVSLPSQKGETVLVQREGDTVRFYSADAHAVLGWAIYNDKGYFEKTQASGGFAVLQKIKIPVEGYRPQTTADHANLIALTAGLAPLLGTGRGYAGIRIDASDQASDEPGVEEDRLVLSSYFLEHVTEAETKFRRYLKDHDPVYLVEAADRTLAEIENEGREFAEEELPGIPVELTRDTSWEERSWKHYQSVRERALHRLARLRVLRQIESAYASGFAKDAAKLGLPDREAFRTKLREISAAYFADLAAGKPLPVSQLSFHLWFRSRWQVPAITFLADLSRSESGSDSAKTTGIGIVSKNQIRYDPASGRMVLGPGEDRSDKTPYFFIRYIEDGKETVKIINLQTGAIEDREEAEKNSLAQRLESLQAKVLESFPSEESRARLAEFFKAMGSTAMTLDEQLQVTEALRNFSDGLDFEQFSSPVNLAYLAMMLASIRPEEPRTVARAKGVQRQYENDGVFGIGLALAAHPELGFDPDRWSDLAGQAFTVLARDVLVPAAQSAEPPWRGDNHFSAGPEGDSATEPRYFDNLVHHLSTVKERVEKIMSAVENPVQSADPASSVWEWNIPNGGGDPVANTSAMLVKFGLRSDAARANRQATPAENYFIRQWLDSHRKPEETLRSRPATADDKAQAVVTMADLEESMVLSWGNSAVAVDAGLSEEDAARYATIPWELEGIFVTHPHADHYQSTAALQQAKGGAIVMTPMTRKWLDHLAGRSERYDALREALGKFGVSLDYYHPVKLKDGSIAVLVPAGHMKGAAAILLITERGTILHTGDFSLDARPGVSPLPRKIELPMADGSMLPIPIDVVIVDASLAYIPTEEAPEKRRRKFIEMTRLALQGAGQANLRDSNSHPEEGSSVIIQAQSAVSPLLLEMIKNDPSLRDCPVFTYGLAQHEIIMTLKEEHPDWVSQDTLFRLRVPEARRFRREEVLDADFQRAIGRKRRSIIIVNAATKSSRDLIREMLKNPNHTAIVAFGKPEDYLGNIVPAPESRERYEDPVRTTVASYRLGGKFDGARLDIYHQKRRETTFSGVVLPLGLYAHDTGGRTSELLADLNPSHVVAVHGNLEARRMLAAKVRAAHAHAGTASQSQVKIFPFIEGDQLDLERLERQQAVLARVRAENPPDLASLLPARSEARVEFLGRPEVTREGDTAVVSIRFRMDPLAMKDTDFLIRWGESGAPLVTWVDEEVLKENEITRLEDGAYRLTVRIRPGRSGDFRFAVHAVNLRTGEETWHGRPQTDDGQLKIDALSEPAVQGSEARDEKIEPSIRAIRDSLGTDDEGDTFVQTMFRLVREDRVRGIGKVVWDAVKDDAGLRTRLSAVHGKIAPKFAPALEKIQKGRPLDESDKAVLPAGLALMTLGIGELVFVTPEADHARAGGMATYISDILNILPQYGISVTMISLLYEQDGAKTHEAAEKILERGVQLASGETVPLREIAGAETVIPLGPTYRSGTHTRGVADGDVLTVGRRIKPRLYEGKAGSGVRMLYLRHPQYADRLYRFTPGISGDKLAKTIFISRGALEVIRNPNLNIHADTVISNDWMAGLIPSFLKRDPAYANDPLLRGLKSLHVFHNMGLHYQCRIFTNENGIDLWPMLGLSGEHYESIMDPNDRDYMNISAAAIPDATAKLTVSLNYAQELLNAVVDPKFSESEKAAVRAMAALLLKHLKSLFGISNGIDVPAKREMFLKLAQKTPHVLNQMKAHAGWDKLPIGERLDRIEQWNREVPPQPVDFEALEDEGYLAALPGLKSRALELMQWTYGFAVNPEARMATYIGRMTDQKGIPLFGEKERLDDGREVSSLEVMLLSDPNVQILIGGPVAEGDPMIQNMKLEELLADLQQRYPGRIVGYFQNIPNHKALEAMLGSLIFLMPSLFEPGGLTQLEALVAGTMVVGRKTGGIAATIIDLATHPDTGNGFLFTAYSGAALVEAFNLAVQFVQNPTEQALIMKNAALAANSWHDRMPLYIALLQSFAGLAAEGGATAGLNDLISGFKRLDEARPGLAPVRTEMRTAESYAFALDQDWKMDELDRLSDEGGPKVRALLDTVHSFEQAGEQLSLPQLSEIQTAAKEVGLDAWRALFFTYTANSVAFLPDHPAGWMIHFDRSMRNLVWRMRGILRAEFDVEAWATEWIDVITADAGNGAWQWDLNYLFLAETVYSHTAAVEALGIGLASWQQTFSDFVGEEDRSVDAGVFMHFLQFLHHLRQYAETPNEQPRRRAMRRYLIRRAEEYRGIVIPEALADAVTQRLRSDLAQETKVRRWKWLALRFGRTELRIVASAIGLERARPSDIRFLFGKGDKASEIGPRLREAFDAGFQLLLERQAFADMTGPAEDALEAHLETERALREAGVDPQNHEALLELQSASDRDFEAGLEALAAKIRSGEVTLMAPVIFYRPGLEKRLSQFVRAMQEAFGDRENDFRIVLLAEKTDQEAFRTFEAGLRKAGVGNSVTAEILSAHASDRERLARRISGTVLRDFAGHYSLFFVPQDFLGMLGGASPKRVVQSDVTDYALASALVPGIAGYCAVTPDAEMKDQTLRQQLPDDLGSAVGYVNGTLHILTQIIQVFARAAQQIAASA